ncbi:MAG: undecaprenyldiphospho-muramoylpentapeptide beta-N-acetylglucosaminyltransferase [Actinomycetota bacterium]
MKVAICGGGTGGHLHPLLALAGDLKSREGIEVILYLSSKTPAGRPPLQAREVTLEVSGFSRGLDAGNLRAAKQLLRAFTVCRGDMKENRPDAAVAFGGYASVPGAAAARSLGIPLILHEQNVIPGMANRLLAPVAGKIAVSFQDTLEICPGWRKKAVVTGNPLWRSLDAGKQEDPWRHFGLERERKTLAVIGGSQGAASLNRAVAQALPLWRERADLQIVHSVGRGKLEEYLHEVAEDYPGGVFYRPLGFVERMDLLYQAADLVVCRAGASTISELAAAGCAAILVPYPYATASHQDANAAVLERAGVAVVIDDEEMDGERLRREVDELLDDNDRLQGMRESSRRIGRPEAAAVLSRLVISCT